MNLERTIEKLDKPDSTDACWRQAQASCATQYVFAGISFLMAAVMIVMLTREVRGFIKILRGEGTGSCSVELFTAVILESPWI